MLITAVLIAFAVFLVYLKSPAVNKQAVLVNADQAPADKNAKAETALKAKEEVKEQKSQAPHFDFYTILPKKELVVPEYEAKTRVREEQVGKHKKTNYILQAGSYTDMKDADELKAKLALMGIESKIQKAKVESVTWYRVKIGPYSQIGSVNKLMSRLQKNGMKPVITEVDG
jgi:cell division protein FtsN